jgi:hypothetical protein
MNYYVMLSRLCAFFSCLLSRSGNKEEQKNIFSFIHTTNQPVSHVHKACAEGNLMATINFIYSSHERAAAAAAAKPSA